VANYRIEGHAIVSADGMIADAEGDKPAALDNAADWARFQTALDQAAIVVLGRRSHEAVPNLRGRNRLILSHGVTALERRGDGLWWNPDGAPLADALTKAAPDGGTAAVIGGRQVFDTFLAAFDSFHLSRTPGVSLPGGVPLFSACGDGTSPGEVLREAGLTEGEREMLDAEAGVSVTVWRR
jgi:dihydrofolate reductase